MATCDNDMRDDGRGSPYAAPLWQTKSASLRKCYKNNNYSIITDFPALLWLLYPKSIVTVNDDGISYSPPRIGPLATGSSLAWEEIQALYVGELTFLRRNEWLIVK